METLPIENVLIIENEYDVDHSIKAFLADFPNLFQKVNKQINCLNRKTEDLMRFIPDADSIMIASTYRYADQVVEYCEAFLNIPKKYNFFVNSACFKFNDFAKDKYNNDKKQLRELIIKMIEAGHQIYDFSEKSMFDMTENDRIYDGNGFYSDYRYPYEYDLLHYDKESDKFYIPTRSYLTLNDVKND